MRLHTPICDRLGIEVPIFLAGMGGVAFAEICAAVSEAGGYGTLGMAMMPPEHIREQMREVRKRTDRPFGVDLLAALPEAVLAAIDVIIGEGASAFIAGLGVPAPVIQKCHDAGLLVMSMCGRVDHATRAEQAGCDVVIAQGSEAGGHTGKIAGMALIPQIVDAVGIPVIAAGSIVDGRGMAAALALGAQGIWMGTRFIASEEAQAGRIYKQKIIDSGSADTRVTRCYSGKPMRVIDNPHVRDWERREDELRPFPEQLIASMGAGLMQFSGEDIDPDSTCLPAGQGLGGIHRVLPAREIIENLVREAGEVISRLQMLTSNNTGDGAG